MDQIIISLLLSVYKASYVMQSADLPKAEKIAASDTPHLIFGCVPSYLDQTGLWIMNVYINLLSCYHTRSMNITNKKKQGRKLYIENYWEIRKSEDSLVMANL